MKKQTRSTKTRDYRKTKRAEGEIRTRSRIVDAAEDLHTTLGPARTSVSAIADRAGVTRATLYRHFPDEESLFLACSSQWMSRQRPPCPEKWVAQHDPLRRLREGLTEIYRYYRGGEAMIALAQRDADSVPSRLVAQRRAAERIWLDTLLQPFPNRRRKTLRATVAHAAAFSTWRSLCTDQGLSDRSAVSLMVGLVRLAEGGDARDSS